MNYARKLSKCIFIGLLMIAAIPPAFAEEKSLQFEGSWCRNSCYYGSAGNDSPHLPCQIDVDSNSVRWDFGKKHFERRLSVVNRTTRSATLILEGGDELAWYSPKSKKQTRWKITIEAPPGVTIPGDALLLSSEPYCAGNGKCNKGYGETLYIFRKAAACS
jgi:hypothetical protein